MLNISSKLDGGGSSSVRIRSPSIARRDGGGVVGTGVARLFGFRLFDCSVVDALRGLCVRVRMDVSHVCNNLFECGLFCSLPPTPAVSILDLAFHCSRNWGSLESGSQRVRVKRQWKSNVPNTMRYSRVKQEISVLYSQYEISSNRWLVRYRMYSYTDRVVFKLAECVQWDTIYVNRPVQ